MQSKVIQLNNPNITETNKGVSVVLPAIYPTIQPNINILCIIIDNITDCLFALFSNSIQTPPN